MNLKAARTIFIDCQTTGMHPGIGSLLEIAWALDCTNVVSRLVELPEGAEIPWRVQEITGIRAEDLSSAVSRETVVAELRSALENVDFALIHYAQFEKPFLNDLFGAEFPVEIFCTHKVTKKLFPALPSRNIRGVSGFFGNHVGEIKRAGSHVRATIDIWNGLVSELAKNGIEEPARLRDWLVAKVAATRKPYEYRIEKEKRLSLPERPGVYRMIAKSGEILYVGKATSLRDRVNSYFRGRKGRDPRKLEMLTQTWDLNFTECGSALEAALLETDEIKRLDPPYNVSLKRGKRKLVFYSRDFVHASPVQGLEHPLGAFRTYNAVEDLRLVQRSLAAGVFLQVFHIERPQEVLSQGFELFLSRVGVEIHDFVNLRSFLALGMRLFRAERDVGEDLDSAAEVVEEPANEDDELTPEEAADKFNGLFVRAGRELWRAKRMTKLLNSRVEWEAESGRHTLEVRGGKITAHGGIASEFPWTNLDIGDYDRMSVLLSGISPVEHSISKL